MTCIRAICAVWLLLCGGALFADYEAPNPAYDPGGYYPVAPPSGTGATLRGNLRTLITGGDFQQLDYADVRFLLDDTDKDPANPNNVLLIYNRASVAGAWDAGVTYNREHIWADSRLGPGNNDPSPSYDGPASDLFNLRPANPGINTSRGNKNFGAVGNPSSFGTSGTYWFPGNADKGDVARALFYMATAYSHLSIVNGDPAANNSQIGDLQALLKWHYTDGIDNFERRRNDVIFDFQGNRNPYVDHPEYVWAAFGDSLNNSQITVASPTVSLGTVFVNDTLPTASLAITKMGTTPTTYDITLAGSAISTAAGIGQSFDYNNVNRNISVGLNASTATAGLKTGTITIDNTDQTTAGGGQGSDDSNDVVNISATVLAHANGSLNNVADANSLLLNFGTIYVGSTEARSFSVSNLAVTPGFTAPLKLVSSSSSGDTATITTNLSAFNGLLEGSSHPFMASADTSTAGSFDAVFMLNLSDDVLIAGALSQQLTLNVAANVAYRRGDFNIDGLVTDADISTMLKALTDLIDYESEKSLTPTALLAIGDFSGDGAVTNLDLQPLLNLIASGAGSLASVPEPASIILLAVGSVVLFRKRRFM